MKIELFQRVYHALAVLEARYASSGEDAPETASLFGLTDREAAKVAILVQWAGRNSSFECGVLTIY